VDIDIPDLLVFSSNTDFHQHPLYKEGKIFLQDKVPYFSKNDKRSILYYYHKRHPQ